MLRQVQRGFREKQVPDELCEVNPDPFPHCKYYPYFPPPPQWWTDLFKFQFPHLQNRNNKICFKNMKAYERGKWVLCPPRPLPSKCRVPNCDFKTLGIPASLPVLSSAHSDQHKGSCMEGENPSTRQENPASCRPLLFPRSGSSSPGFKETL